MRPGAELGCWLTYSWARTWASRCSRHNVAPLVEAGRATQHT